MACRVVSIDPVKMLVPDVLARRGYPEEYHKRKLSATKSYSDAVYRDP